MKEPLLSIILPTYNSEKYLPRCFESIMNQTYKHIELIVIDDGSTDSTFDVFKNYSQNEKMFRYIRNSKNVGAAEARNIGLKHALGQFIGFIDSDDWIEPNMYEMMMNIIVNEDSEVVCCGRFNHEDNRVTEGFCPLKNEVIDGNTLLNKMFVYDNEDFALWNKIFKRELWDGVSFPSGFITEDVPVLYKILLNVKKVSLVNEKLYHHCYHIGSVTAKSFSERDFDFEHHTRDILLDVKNYHSELTDNAVLYRLKALIYTISFTGKIKRKSYKQYQKYLYSFKQELSKYKKLMTKRQKTIYHAYLTHLARVYYHLHKIRGLL